MTNELHTDDMASWEQFVITHGWKAWAYDLAAVLGQSVQEIERVRSTGACTQLRTTKRFAELFTLWHGRQPTDDEWPMPFRYQRRGTYEWQPPELALLAGLVGQLGVADIAKVLTSRLRTRTNDPEAERTPTAVQNQIGRIGLQSKDVLGGLTTADAGRDVGALSVVQQAIRSGQLSTINIGPRRVVPFDIWERWKAKRTLPPQGYVRLSTLRTPLAIRSDKLSEYARMGYVPTAIRCNTYGAKGPSTQFGTWYIDEKLAVELVAARRAGRPMPWHGKPLIDNLRKTFQLWEERKHPPTCKTCIEIWGEVGVPRSFDDYLKHYPPLAHGAKRHLTRPWDPGLTLAEVALQAACDIERVHRAVDCGMLSVSVESGEQYVSRTDATKWISRKCPNGESDESWISVETACKQYLFADAELRGFIAQGVLPSKVGTAGAARGVVYVARHQCGQLRERIGFTEEQAAQRIGVTIERFRVLVDGVNWRKAEGIPLVTIQAVIKRLESRAGYTLEEAAAELGTTVEWIKARRDDGTIKIAKAKWDRRRLYVTAPMLERLRQALAAPTYRDQLSEDWLSLSDAAYEAGVSTTTLCKWGDCKELDRRISTTGWRYHREAVRAKARSYWKSVRFHRATPPAWLQAELN